MRRWRTKRQLEVVHDQRRFLGLGAGVSLHRNSYRAPLCAASMYGGEFGAKRIIYTQNGGE